MNGSAHDQLAAEVARALVARAAPHELPIFRAASRAYFAKPDRALRRRSVDEMLGFGADSMSALTPYALAVASAVIERLGGEVGRQEPLTPEQVDFVRQLSLEEGRQLGLDEDKAALLADALVGSLQAA